VCGKCSAPALVAFSGKKQYVELLNIGRKGAAKIKTVELGRQPKELLPPGADSACCIRQCVDLGACCAVAQGACVGGCTLHRDLAASTGSSRGCHMP
jgi:hypothetical protein